MFLKIKDVAHVSKSSLKSDSDITFKHLNRRATSLLICGLLGKIRLNSKRRQSFHKTKTIFFLQNLFLDVRKKDIKREKINAYSIYKGSYHSGVLKQRPTFFQAAICSILTIRWQWLFSCTTGVLDKKTGALFKFPSGKYLLWLVKIIPNTHDI